MAQDLQSVPVAKVQPTFRSSGNRFLVSCAPFFECTEVPNNPSSVIFSSTCSLSLFLMRRGTGVERWSRVDASCRVSTPRPQERSKIVYCDCYRLAGYRCCEDETVREQDTSQSEE